MTRRWGYLRMLIPAGACSFFLYNAVRMPSQRTLSIVFAIFAALWALKIWVSMQRR